jgi:hypothetical protein
MLVRHNGVRGLGTGCFEGLVGFVQAIIRDD